MLVFNGVLARLRERLAYVFGHFVGRMTLATNLQLGCCIISVVYFVTIHILM